MSNGTNNIIGNNGIIFKVTSVDNNIISNNPLDEISIDVLQELVDNGLAQLENEECSVPYEAIYQLCKSDREILGIPSYYPHKLFLSANGLLNAKELTFNIVFCESKHGQRFKAERIGAFIKIGDNNFILDDKQFELFQIVDNFNAKLPSEKTANSNFIAFAQIKKAALNAGALLDKYLLNENVYSPQNIGIHIDKNADGSVTVTPDIHQEYNNQFVRYFDSFKNVPENFALSDTDKNDRLRVTFNDKIHEALNKIKARRKTNISKDTGAIDFFLYPEKYLDPETCDLSEFYSDRVIEIGAYKPKFYSFSSPFQSSWIPSFRIEDKYNGTTNISFTSKEKLEELAFAIKKAEEENNYAVKFKDVTLNIDDAKEIYARAERKLLINEQKCLETPEEKKVLIIEENAEELGFNVEGKASPEWTPHAVEPAPNLKKNICLKEHQKEGVAWLQYLFEEKFKGGLLADDMGLGKTLQILSFIDWHHCKYHSRKPYLIVAPISLIENWQKEYYKFFNNLIRIFPAVGSVLARFQKTCIDKELITLLDKEQIVLTNYETIRNYQFSFCAVDFSVIVLDEAQKIKTPGTLVTNSAKALKAEFKIAMTGTPVENTLVDVWCIMDFCVPGLLGNCKEFSKKYQVPMKNEDTDVAELGNSIREEMGYYFLRRIKSDVAKDLPQKSIEKIAKEMPPEQKNRYIKLVNEAIEEKNSEMPAKGYMLTYIQKMRETVDHPYLYREDFFNLSVPEIVASSAKLQVTLEILNDIQRKNEKVILFTDRREVQRMLQKVIKDYFHFTPRIINGDTLSIPSVRNNGRLSRQQTIDSFQEKPGFNIIIMSPVAAGIGLNVTAANHVIHYSRHWNPAKEEQATDRAYRIGQTQDVYVYYPMAISEDFPSFDQTIDALLSRKMNLANATLFPTERAEVNSEELFNSLINNSHT